MDKKQLQYLKLPTNAAVELLATTEGKAILEAVYGYLREKQDKRPSFVAQEGGRNPGQNWLDSCVTQLIFEYRESDAPFSASIDLAAESLRNKSKKDFNKAYHSNRAKAYPRTNEPSVSFFDSEVISPNEAQLHHLVNYFKPLVQFLNRIDEYAQFSGNIDIKEPLGDLRNHIGTWSTDALQKLKSEICSIYAIAKKDGVDYRRLLYVLKKVRFPLAKLKGNREFFFVFPDRKQLFDVVYARIKYFWKMEDNYRAWTREFLSLGWSKSRTSQFMRRKINSGLLPKWFFDCFPPDKIMAFRLVNNDPTLIGIHKLEEIMPLLKPRNAVMRELKVDVAQAKKTILNS